MIYPGNIGAFVAWLRILRWDSKLLRPIISQQIVKLNPVDKGAAFRESIKAGEAWEIAPQRGTSYAMARRKNYGAVHCRMELDPHP